jgi:hypothetical protein
VRRIEFAFRDHGLTPTPLLASIRFLDGEGRAVADLLGRTELEFFYRDVDPNPAQERWEVESVSTLWSRPRVSAVVGPDPVAGTGYRTFTHYYRRDLAVGSRGGELAAIRFHDHVGRQAGVAEAWGPTVHAVGFQRRRDAETVLFFDPNAGPVADGYGLFGYRETFDADGVRTSVTDLDAEGECAADPRTQDGGRSGFCRLLLTGVPVPPAADAPVPRLASPYAVAYRDAAGNAAPGPEGVVAFSLRDLGPALAPCERLLGVQHHDDGNALIAPPSGPFRGAAATRIAVRFNEGRLGDLVRTDCFDGPCKLREVFDETWTCDGKGCGVSTVPLSCR